MSTCGRHVSGKQLPGRRSYEGPKSKTDGDSWAVGGNRPDALLDLQSNRMNHFPLPEITRQLREPQASYTGQPFGMMTPGQGITIGV